MVQGSLSEAVISYVGIGSASCEFDTALYVDDQPSTLSARQCLE